MTPQVRRAASRRTSGHEAKARRALRAPPQNPARWHDTNPKANDASWYGDAACTKPVHMAYPDSICEAKYMAVTRFDLTCPPTKRVFAKGAAKTGPTFYIFNGVCTASGSFPYIESGAELPASSFEAVTSK